MPDAIAQFANAKYLNLETFRKNGSGVCTPVWFAQAPAQSAAVSGPDVFYVYSEAEAGKVKRIRNNSKVRVAPCDMRGNLRGAWVEATCANLWRRGSCSRDSNCCDTSTG
jgi:PPOX class probable F420-dependent enzyme